MAVYEASSGASIVNAGHRFHQDAEEVCQRPQTMPREARDMRERRDSRFGVQGSKFRKPRTSGLNPPPARSPCLSRPAILRECSPLVLARIIHEHFCCNRGNGSQNPMRYSLFAPRSWKGRSTSLDRWLRTWTRSARRPGRRACRSDSQHTVSSMPPSLAAPRACLAWRLRDFATSRHK
jgi:hypothetical protein